MDTYFNYKVNNFFFISEPEKTDKLKN